MKIEVTASTFGTHTHQIFCGLNLLKKEGKIGLRYKSPPKWLKNRTTRQLVHCTQWVDDRQYTHVFDLNDSSSVASDDALNNCDFYHKRSFAKEGYGNDLSHRILPFGLNYQVQSESLIDFILRPSYDFIYYPYNPLIGTGKSQSKEILKYGRDYLFQNSKNKQILRYFELEHPPKDVPDGPILFQCRLWNPKDFPQSARPEIERLNLVRIELIELLSSTFGNRFLGGLQPSDYSNRVAPHLVVQRPTNRRAYLELVKSASIVITTNGISDSIGWKMGEFVAASKPIVCEPLRHRVTGNFRSGTHYLEYTSAKDCVALCEYLIENPSEQTNLSKNCQNYYKEYLNPASIVFNALTAGLSKDRC